MRINYDKDHYYMFSVFNHDCPSPFPTERTCHECYGRGGFDNLPRYTTCEQPDYYYEGCQACDEIGIFFNPTTRLVRRYTINRKVANG